ncbi:hypothetical protein ACFXPN_46690 [Streptomyces griseorubiginosus]|uniref:WD40 repeat domain-containing protein n=1 Tax=Streptomyces griseorubiginosus TaxID=67304 RepID=UPI0036A54837
MTTLSQAAAGRQLPTLPVTLAYVGACGGDLTEWEGRWKETVAQAAGDGLRDDDGSLVPYRGLARFETTDSDVFHGREQLTTDLVDLLRHRRFAAVFGPSGSGKSSLLRAGLVPVLRSSQEPGLRPAAIRILTPGEQPARNHAPLLAPVVGRDGGDEADTLVIVDQFEEVFTLCQDAGERTRFIDSLLAARRPESRLRVLLAVRGDFYGRCAEHRDLADALRDANLLAGAMNPAELRDAVVKPATAAGLTVERALTARLVEEVAGAPGGLPLLSHALLETWRRRRGKTLTLAGYEAAGCLDGAIAKTAEKVYARFTADQATAARRLLLRMVVPGDGTPDTRRPLERAELPDTGRDDFAHVLEALARARLLTLHGDTVEMAHESLITAWPRLRGWINEDRERLRSQRSLTEAAHTWQQLGREEGALYRGSRLTAALEHFGEAPREELTDLEQAFLEAGRGSAQRGRRRHRLILTTVTTALCLALLTAGLALVQRHHALTAQRLAESRQLAAQSGALLSSDPDLAALLAVHAYRTSATREATAALYAAAALPLRKQLTTGTAPVDAAALNSNGRTLATHSRDGRIQIWELPEGRVRHTMAAPGDGEIAAFSPDGRILAVATTTAISLWDATDGRELATLRTPDGAVRGMAFSPDGRSLAAASTRAVRVWDVAGGRTRHTLTDHPDPKAVTFGPDGHTVAAADRNGLVRVWDASTGRTRSVHDSRIKGTAVAFSADGRTYAAVRTDGVVELRQVRNGTVRRTLRGGSASSYGQVVFAPDGRTLAVPGAGDTVLLWDTATGTPLTTVTAGYHGRGILSVALDANERTLVTSSNLDPVVRIHSLSAVHPRATLPARAATSIADLAFSPDSRTLSTFGQGPHGQGPVQLWDARTGRHQAALTLDSAGALRSEAPPVVLSRPAATAFDPTGRAVAARLGRNGRIEVRDVATGHLRHSRAVGRGTADTLHFSPDGTQLALVGADGSLRIWHLSTGALHTLRTRHDQPIRTVAFAPDGRTLAVATIETRGDQVVLLDAVTGRVRRTMKQRTAITSPLVFSPDGHTFTTTSGDGRMVETWDTRTGRLQDTFSADSPVQALAFSPDGRTLALGGARGVRLWDRATHQSRRTLPAGSFAVMAFSPDGRTLAVTAGGSVALWNIELPNPAHAIRVVCAAVDTPGTSREQTPYRGYDSASADCAPTT